MRLKFSALTAIACSLVLLSCNDVELTSTLSGYQPREGDILFQDLDHLPLVDMIKNATFSRYAHCGIVERCDSSWFVLEPFPRVKETPLAKFVGRGVGSTVDAFRLRDEYQACIPRLLDTVRSYLGWSYDFQFELDDNEVYCSELVYASFQKACNDTLGRLQPLRSMHWQPYERSIRRLGRGQLPLDRLIISPHALSMAPQLRVVYRGLSSGSSLPSPGL